MLSDRSILQASVIPVPAYPSAPEVAAWLCDVFGFEVRLRVDEHRVQLNVGDGAVIVRELRLYEDAAALGLGHNMTGRVAELDAHYEHARQHGGEGPRDICRPSVRRAPIHSAGSS